MKDEANLKKKVREIYDCKENVLNYIVKSNGSVEYTPKNKISSIFKKTTEN